MMDSFDLVALVRAMRKEKEDEDLFVEKSNGKRVVIHPEDVVADVSGCLVIINDHRHIAINPIHVMSVITKGDL